MLHIDVKCMELLLIVSDLDKTRHSAEMNIHEII